MEEDWNVVQLLAHHRRKFKIPSQAPPASSQTEVVLPFRWLRAESALE